MEICGKEPNCGVAMRPPEETTTWLGGSTHSPLSLRRALTRMARRTCETVRGVMNTKIPERLPVSPMTLVCPFCKAKPGDDCASSSGGYLALAHVT
jgi:hypothetical protein